MKTGRNDPCPCGAGKKWKKCCALLAVSAPVAVAAAPAPTDDAVVTIEPAVAGRRANTWVPLQHQAETLRLNRFGRKKDW